MDDQATRLVWVLAVEYVATRELVASAAAFASSERELWLARQR